MRSSQLVPRPPPLACLLEQTRVSKKRSGLCYVGFKRHAQANKKYIADYNPNKDSNYLMHWDANNLYGWAMTQNLE